VNIEVGLHYIATHDGGDDDDHIWSFCLMTSIVSINLRITENELWSIKACSGRLAAKINNRTSQEQAHSWQTKKNMA